MLFLRISRSETSRVGILECKSGIRGVSCSKFEASNVNLSLDAELLLFPFAFHF